MMSVSYKFCSSTMAGKLVSFINDYWKKDHVFVRSRSLLDWQHKNSEGDYNFVLAVDDSEEVLGVLGFIPTSQFSQDLDVNLEYWLAIWKVREDINMPGLGMGMLNFLRREKGVKSICSVGLSQEVISLYKALKYDVGQLKQYAFFNQVKSEFMFVQPPSGYKISCQNPGNYQVEYLTPGEILSKDYSHLFNTRPQKNSEYIVNRYVKHPSYEYKVASISDGDRVCSLVVFRIIELEGCLVARVVDVQGQSILSSKFNKVISNILVHENLEYLDVLTNCTDLDQSSGFKLSGEQFFVPNYFEPLEMKEVIIDYAYKSSSELVIYKGDSDQDRPNL